MGMFDYVVIPDPELRARAKCAAGHEQPASHGWQTKDLDCAMDSISLTQDGVYVQDGSWLDDEDQPEPPVGPGERLNHTGQIWFYTFCQLCPVTYWSNERRKSAWSPQESRPWIEYVALVRNGQVLSLDPVRLETVAEDSEQMRAFGWKQVDEKGNPL